MSGAPPTRGLKTRDARRALQRAGFTTDRQTATHQTWHHPSGVSVVLPVGSADLSPNVARNIGAAIDTARSGKRRARTSKRSRSTTDPGEIAARFPRLRWTDTGAKR